MPCYIRVCARKSQCKPAQCAAAGLHCTALHVLSHSSAMVVYHAPEPVPCKPHLILSSSPGCSVFSTFNTWQQKASKLTSALVVSQHQTVVPVILLFYSCVIDKERSKMQLTPQPPLIPVAGNNQDVASPQVTEEENMQVLTGAFCVPLICIFQSVCPASVPYANTWFRFLGSVKKEGKRWTSTANPDMYRFRFSRSSSKQPQVASS